MAGPTNVEMTATEMDTPTTGEEEKVLDTGTTNTSSSFSAAPRSGWELLFQGAEAKVWKLSDGRGGWRVCKERFAKSYRHAELDDRLRKSRCRSEAKVLEKCAKFGDSIRVPRVIRVDPPLLYLEHIRGRMLKDYWWDPTTSKSDAIPLGVEMGKLIGRLHNAGVVHGDLTTSNMMIQDETLVLIDFGLAKSTTNVEEQAVDLYVLERALQSTHPDLPEDFFPKLLEAYGEVVESKKSSQSTLQRLEQVRLRGRKRECFG